ncbi:MAG: exodeoxyribonuclease VII large subunit [Fibrobacter sp.]|nr:exodeoxyribonuclease VII large subunit [Fibrobacter sp.]
MNTPKSYSLSKYLSSVQRLVQEKIPPVWVHGVISQINIRGRACYIDLSEYEEGDVKPVAVLSLFIFTSELSLLNAKLASLAQPFTLAKDLKVSLLLQAGFYIPQGRFQARIIDIDPNYTLGELALTRQKIIKKLQTENLINRNKALPFSAMPMRVGLISAEGSAAYNDFVSSLEKSQFAFDISFISAKMQGQETENSVLKALGELQQIADLDVICIVRGGGSKADLNYFDSDSIARAIALAKVPVLTGIGHEIDQSIADLVAWQACITPTECAQLLLRRCTESWLALESIIDDIGSSARQKLQVSHNILAQIIAKFSATLPRRLHIEHLNYERNVLGLKQGSRKILEWHQMQLLPYPSRLHNLVKGSFAQTDLKLKLLEQKLKSLDPQEVLRRGYSLSTINGKIPQANQAKVGDELITRYFWGEIKSKVQ